MHVAVRHMCTRDARTQWWLTEVQRDCECRSEPRLKRGDDCNYSNVLRARPMTDSVRMSTV
jgi:hypothetical protein